MVTILKTAKNTGRASKSAKFIKNSKTHIFGGLKRPIEDKKYRAKNNIKKAKQRFNLLKGFDMAFLDEPEFKAWLVNLNRAIYRPVNCRHNLNQIYKVNPLYHNKYIARFDIAIRDTVF